MERWAVNISSFYECITEDRKIFRSLGFRFFPTKGNSLHFFPSRSKFHNPISRNSVAVSRKNDDSAAWNKTWAIKLQIR